MNLRGVNNIEDEPRDIFGRIPKEGNSVHSFTKGWLIYYGTEYIPVDTWWKIKIAGLGNYKSNPDI